MRNMQWQGFTSANGDTDLFMTQLQNLIDQGVQGIVVDPDTTIVPAVATLLGRHPEVKWATHMAAPRDGSTGAGVPVGGHMVNNYVGFDNYDAGVQTTLKLLEWKDENFPNVPWSDVGFIAINFSISPPLAEREQGARDTLAAHVGGLNNTNYFEADAVGIGLNMQGGMDATAPIISMNSQIKHWLVMGLIDDTSQGAAAVLSQQGLEDTSCVVTFGGSGLIRQWDAGQHDAFRYALYAGPPVYSEPISGAVYSYLMGWATPESIWPSWIHPDDHGGPGKTYSQFRLPTYWMTPDNYKHYLAWCDIYSGGNNYPEYPRDGITVNSYSPFAPIPKGFSGNP
jgi:ABC-type sugar transport system substrate-binding protein